MLNDLHAKAYLNRACWVMAGGANGEPGDCEILSALLGLGDSVVSDGKPTGWEGTRCVDWFVANRSDLLSGQGHCEAHLTTVNDTYMDQIDQQATLGPFMETNHYALSVTFEACSGSQSLSQCFEPNSLSQMV